MSDVRRPPVLAVVLNWRQPEATLAAVGALAAMGYPGLEILVIESGSGDGSAARLRAALPEARLLELRENRGFAAGSNRGLREARERGFDWALLINNDALAAPEMLDHLMSEAAPDIALLAPKILYAGDPERIWFAGGRMHPALLEIRDSGRGELDSEARSRSRDVDYLFGTCLLVNLQAVAMAGPLDPTFFLYYEDLDWCLRLREAGYRLRMVGAARLYHQVSTSSGGEDSPLHRYHLSRSSVLFFRRHAHRGTVWAILLFRLASALKTGARLAVRGRFGSVFAHLRGLRDGLSLAAGGEGR